MHGLSRQTLIYYDKIDLFKPAHVEDNGYRLYAATQIPKLREICLLKDLAVPLDQIHDALASRSPELMIDLMRNQRDLVDRHVDDLNRLRRNISLRMDFYTEVHTGERYLEQPIIRSFPERRVLFTPFPTEDRPVDRVVLHVTLAHCWQVLREMGRIPSRGFGTRICLDSLNSADAMVGAGIFIIIDQGEILETSDTSSHIEVLPAGQYLCYTRWGMPYDTSWADFLLPWAARHGVTLSGDAYDCNLLDETYYDDEHHVDFCNIQIKAEVTDDSLLPVPPQV